MQIGTVLRVARSSDRLAAVTKFYTEGLGLEVLGSFEDHDGFDGIMIGRRGESYHLEFTHRRGHVACTSASLEDLLVFYFPDASEWRAAVERLGAAGYESVQSINPYWDRNGRTFADPDGYRVVLQNSSWPD